jgi:hypothetical protein
LSTAIASCARPLPLARRAPEMVRREAARYAVAPRFFLA